MAKRAFFTIDPAVVHEACEAMRECRDIHPQPIEDLAGNWIAQGRVLKVERLRSAHGRFMITVSGKPSAEARG